MTKLLLLMTILSTSVFADAGKLVFHEFTGQLCTEGFEATARPEFLVNCQYTNLVGFLKKNVRHNLKAEFTDSPALGCFDVKILKQRIRVPRQERASCGVYLVLAGERFTDKAFVYTPVSEHDVFSVNGTMIIYGQELTTGLISSTTDGEEMALDLEEILTTGTGVTCTTSEEDSEEIDSKIYSEIFCDYDYMREV